MIKLNINGKEIQTEKGKTVLEAALAAGVYVPNLCRHPDLPYIASCRLCVVEIEGMRGYPASCTVEAKDGMKVKTDTPALRSMRKTLVWLTLSEYPGDPQKDTQLEKVVEHIGREDRLSDYVHQPKNIKVWEEEPLFIRDMNKCILCGRCVSICRNVRKTGVLGFVNRGIRTVIGTSYDKNLKDSDCVFCRACVEVCPSGALKDKQEYTEAEKEKTLIPCVEACPGHTNVPVYVQMIAQGRYQDSYEMLRQKLTFPRTLGYVCDHPCEQACSRGEVNEPICIRFLKRFVSDRDTKRWKSKLKIKPDTGKKVAIVGGGPAGLTAAWFLRTKGHKTMVFEALPQAGGMMRTGIPEYRLPREILDGEINDMLEIGVEIRTNSPIESVKSLFAEGYDAVFLALGAQSGTKMGIEGEEDPGVLDGITLLKSVNLKEGTVKIAGHVVVVGGGNVAIDVARVSLRKGAKKVTIIYRRTRKEMPAAGEEIEEALKEGIDIQYLTAPRKVKPAGQRVNASGQKVAPSGQLEIECVKMELGEPDKSGRRRPVEVKGSEFKISADLMVAAIGQKPVLFPELDPLLNETGWIAADPVTLECKKKGLFAGGDMETGPASVIKALAAGRKAASAIDRMFGGDGEIDHKFIPEEETLMPREIGRQEAFAYRERAEIPVLPVEKRADNFNLVEQGFTDAAARKESERCLKCQLRLRIKKTPMPF